MAKSKSTEKIPDLRDFVKENDQRLFDFCSYMLQGGFSLEELTLSIFRDFGDAYRNERVKGRANWETSDARRILFEKAWNRIREMMERIQYTWSVGRDTRPLKSLDEDLLGSWSSQREKTNSPVTQMAMERLNRVAPDFRAPLILRDVLQFEDEEVVQILGLRWGVYRLRLHRGRLEYKDALRGRPVGPVLSVGAAGSGP